ncbi:hypothetical protein IJG72_03940 [bacterium]|nr:hypothetical protein [bacterium]
MTSVDAIKTKVFNIKESNVVLDKNKIETVRVGLKEALTSNPLKKFLEKEAILGEALVALSAVGVNKLSKTLKNTPVGVTEVKGVDDKNTKTVYQNGFKSMLQQGQAKILAIIPRTFNAKDTNGDEKISDGEEHGTFLNAIARLDEIKAEGFNTFHILPIHPTGKKRAMGIAGSLYSPLDFLQIDPNLIDKNDKRSGEEQFKTFVNECHKRGIRVMLDLPSCASYDMYLRKPKLMAKQQDGQAKTPQGWNDIRMLEPFEDTSKRTLNKDLINLHKKYVDMCIDLGIDGIRADVARAKPTEFWDIIIPYSHSKDPQFGWLAETYTYEDASPQANMPYDRPEDSLKAGFDAYYGQYHIFHEWHGAKDLMDFVKENLQMSKRLEKGKSLIGSFTTHDDISPMFHGGVEFCNLTAGLQATLPMLNPYYVDGYQSGDDYVYDYARSRSEKTETDSHIMTVHPAKLDIFNLSRKPGGNNPEIGKFMTETFKMRDKYQDLITKGSFIELSKSKDKDDQVIAYARHKDGKTLLVLANKNVNRNVTAKVNVPTLKANQELKNLLPSYGKKSKFQVKNEQINVNLGPGRVHVFEIDTPNIEKNNKNVYKQNL